MHLWMVGGMNEHFEWAKQCLAWAIQHHATIYSYIHDEALELLILYHSI